MSAWKALNARITLFPGGPPVPASPSAQEIYRKVWGADPESFQKQQNPFMPSIAQGMRGGRTTNVLAHPTRVDLTLTPWSPETGEMTVGFIENTKELLIELARMVNVLAAEIMPIPISRVGLSMQVATMVQTSEEGNKVVTRAMPEEYRVTLTNEEDFVFQVNRQRKSGVVQKVIMNFISKWSVEKVQVLRMFPGSITFPAAPQMQIFTVASLTLDHNNIPTEKHLNLQEQSQLLHEGLAEAEETLKAHHTRSD